MRIAYLDCFSGISGDMFLGALVDAGVSPSVFEQTVAALNLGARLEISKVNRSGISATKVDVYVNGEKDLPREEYEKQGAHSHEHGHHSHNHGRGLSEIKRIIQKAAISEAAKLTASAIFQNLGEAEAKIHNANIETIHFHEVGAVDALVDIICAAVGAEALGVDEIICSPLNVGGGTVQCAHGTFPVPAPATVELLKGAPVFSSGVQAELVTPTGAAIVKTLAKRFASFPAMRLERVGYGAGSRDFTDHANVLRISVGQSAGVPAGATEETICILEANLDDLNPQVVGYVMDRLLAEGALDVFTVPVQMKKNRPGTILTALCPPESGDKLSQIILAETSTLGVRRRNETRTALARTWMPVMTSWGDVRIKVATMNGTVTHYAPEYEDCRKIAAEYGIPLKQVMQEAVQRYLGVIGQKS